jgi:division protein CdvB (Snf7/Vps24/ESCRT-III family)
MQAELDALESKLAQLVQLTIRLREENHHLRQELVQALSQGRQCQDKLDTVKSRLERLLTQLPEE